MKYLVSVPYTTEEYKDEFLKYSKLDNISLIDNTIKNIGFPNSTNINMQKFLEQDADWFIVCGTSIRFGEPGGLDFIEALEKTKYLVVEAQPVYGWHLIAFHRTIIDKVGFWDENFVPYGYDDLDYSLRIQKAFNSSDLMGEKSLGSHNIWTKTTIDVNDAGMGHSVKMNKIDLRPELNEQTREYYRSKWGLYPGNGENIENTYKHPFNDPSNDISYFPSNKEYVYYVN